MLNFVCYVVSRFENYFDIFFFQITCNYYSAKFSLEFYGDLVYKFKKNGGSADFSDQFKTIIVRYKRIGYNINIMRQSA